MADPTRRVALVSTGRADLSSCAALWRALAACPEVETWLWVVGDVERVRDEAAALCPAARLRCADDPDAIQSATARWVREVSPHLVAVVGDRWELLPVCAALVLGRVPTLHLSGGELTLGALDEQVRHAVTKMAHLHAVAHEEFRARVVRMGESPWRVRVTGDLGLDAVREAEVSTRDELSARLGLSVGRDTLAVAMHPETALDAGGALAQWESVSRALDAHPGAVVVTGPNRDPGADALARAQRAWCEAAPARRRWVDHLGARGFLGLLRHGGALVGNSSAGIWEAPTLGAPAVNVGRRQEGRLRGANVIDVPEVTVDAVRAAVARATAEGFRAACEGAVNPYGDGRAGPRVAAMVREMPDRDRLLRKRFDEEATRWTASS